MWHVYIYIRYTYIVVFLFPWQSLPVAPQACFIADTMAPALVLAEGIRNWVLIPITLSMILVGLIRAYTAKLMKREPKLSRDKIAHAQTLIRYVGIARSRA